MSIFKYIREQCRKPQQSCKHTMNKPKPGFDAFYTIQKPIWPILIRYSYFQACTGQLHMHEGMLMLPTIQHCKASTHKM